MALHKFEDLVIRESTEEMLEKIQNVGFVNMIIAMKGDAYTGKTTCANAIAKAYNCSIVSFDSILDALSASAPSPQEYEGLIDLAFTIVLRVVRLQLHAARPVVIDSPLSKQSHLDQLLAVADEFQSCGNPVCDKLHCRSVIVECKPESKYTWEKRFENRGSQVDANKWYKPKEWNHVVQTESVENYLPERLPGHVCRLIVNTTGCVPGKYRNLGAATLDIASCPKGHLLHFRDWLPHKPFHTGFNPIYAIDKCSGRAPPQQSGEDPEVEPPIKDIICGQDGRHMLEEVTEVEEGGLGCCRSCHGPISYPADLAYVCTRCKLALHKKCAELEHKVMIRDSHSNLPPFLRIISSANEFYSSIPEEYKKRFKCSSCKEFSVDCEFCLWEMHLGAGDVPTMVRHEGHDRGDHCIGFWIVSRQTVDRQEYLCEGCKLPGYCVGYTCLHGTFKFNYHVECALLPRPMSHVHGGHHHDMELVFGTDEIKEDYICDVCLDPILDPKAWYFYCGKCDFTSHLHCIYKND